jgi:hypothetical protein
MESNMYIFCRGIQKMHLHAFKDLMSSDQYVRQSILSPSLESLQVDT